MSYTKILLAGAAMSALTAASAFAAAPNFHLASTLTSKAIHLKSNHNKTQVAQPNGKAHYTVTLTFTGQLSVKTAYQNPILLPAYTWYSSATCTQASKEKIKYSKASAGKISTATSTGSISGCTGTTFTFFGGDYTLTNKKAKSDTFTGTLTGTTPSYKLKLVENFDFTISKK